MICVSKYRACTITINKNLHNELNYVDLHVLYLEERNSVLRQITFHMFLFRIGCAAVTVTGEQSNGARTHTQILSY